MTQHWTDEQMTAWALGERKVEMAEHLAACDACRRELAQLQESLTAFRGDVQQAASADEYRWTRIRHAVASRAVERSHGLRWAFTTALALVALSVGLLVTPYKHTVQPVQKVEMSDEQLLNEINDDLSRSAPEALAPVESLQQERASLLAQANSQGTSQQTDRRQ
jgi:hypothetical protein